MCDDWQSPDCFASQTSRRLITYILNRVCHGIVKWKKSDVKHRYALGSLDHYQVGLSAPEMQVSPLPSRMCFQVWWAKQRSSEKKSSPHSIRGGCPLTQIEVRPQHILTLPSPHQQKKKKKKNRCTHQPLHKFLHLSSIYNCCIAVMFHTTNTCRSRNVGIVKLLQYENIFGKGLL